MSGTAIAQLIAFCLSPVVSRFYSPSDFGLFGSFNSIVTIISSFITLHYSQAIMLPSDDNEAKDLLFISLFSVIAISVLSLLSFIFFSNKYLSFLNTQHRWIFLLLFIGILVNGFNLTIQAWAIRRKHFKHTSASQVIRTLSSNTITLISGFFHSGAIGLIAGAISGNFFASINLFIKSLKTDLWKGTHVTLSKSLSVARKYIDFPMYSAPQNLVNALSQGLPVLLLSHYYSIDIAGAYAFSIRVLQVPAGFVLTALRQVLFQKASESYNAGNNLFPLFSKITIGLFLTGILPSFIVILKAPSLFMWIFGKSWYLSGEFSRWIIIWTVISFCNVPAVIFSRIFRIQKLILIYELILLAGRVAVLVFGGLHFSPLKTIQSFSIIGASLNLLLILWVGFIVKKRKGKLYFSDN